MTRQEIKNKMIESITNTLNENIEKLVLNEIDEDTISEFLWEKDFGIDMARNCIEEFKETMIEEYLEEIYSDIDTDDIYMPF